MNVAFVTQPPEGEQPAARMGGGHENFCIRVYTSYFIFHDAVTSLNMAHTYNKGYTVKIARNVIQCTM
jgi:hypothetical protein